MNKFNGFLFGFAAFFLPLALYIRTLAPTYIPIDSAEFALCMKFAGICHPPGFPLYVFLGKIFTDFFPIGSLVYKANLFSSIFGAGTILFVYLALIELKVKRELAFLLSIFLAVNSVFWEFATSADVFTFATFLIALTFFFAFKSRPLLAFFTLGLSASHFYITAILWPLFLWYFFTETGNWKQETGNKGKSLLFIVYSLLFFALGFFPQILLYWRMQQAPEINWGHHHGISGFIDFIRRKEFGSIFLIANPVLTFSPVKVFKHLAAYFASLLLNFGVILPIIGAFGLFLGRLYKDRRFVLLLLSFGLILLVQLVPLSTIDPFLKDSSFQINKFYLSSFVIVIFLIGLSFDRLSLNFFGENRLAIYLFLAVLIVLYTFANFKARDFSQNYFSQNFNLDALEQLPERSIAITLSHTFYFGGLYEQKINHRFEKISLLYFPNEKNRDMESYNRELFAGEIDKSFVDKVVATQEIGNAENYILKTISKNLDKEIFILQGTFEEKFFGYLAPYLTSYGLWWKLETDQFAKADIDGSISQLDNLRNKGLTVFDLHLKQQKDDLLAYAVSFHSTGIGLASAGQYDGALKFLEKSLKVNPEAKNLEKEIDLIKATREQEARFDQLVDGENKDLLSELASNLFTLKNFERCAQVYSVILNFSPGEAAVYNNLASCWASAGEKEAAKINYLKALEIDPNLEKAKKGLEALE